MQLPPPALLSTCYGLLQVSPPLGVLPPLFFCRDTVSPVFAAEVPIFAVVGDTDQFCSQQRFQDFCERLQARD